MTKHSGTSRGGKLMLIAIAVGAVELASIVAAADWIGAGETFLLILLMSALGIIVAKREGQRAWREAQRQMSAGQPPGPALVQGICVLAGGVLLLVPGFVSDIIGLTLLLPPTRRLYRGLIISWIEKRLRNGTMIIRR